MVDADSSEPDADGYIFGFCNETMLLFRRKDGKAEPALPIVTDGCAPDDPVVGEWPDGSTIEFSQMTIQRYLEISGMAPVERMASYAAAHVPGEELDAAGEAALVEGGSARALVPAEDATATGRILSKAALESSGAADVLIELQHSESHHSLVARQKVDHKLLIVIYEQKISFVCSGGLVRRCS